MKIGHQIVSPDQPVYVIAEIGSNHDGSLAQAKRLIQAAADTGADAAKFQLFRADTLYPGTVTAGAIPDWWLPELKACCHEEGLEFLCSVFCQETLDAYMEVSPAAIKIASPEAADLEFLAMATSTGLPLLISTGAMDWSMLNRTILALEDVVGGAGIRDDICLLHCVSAYPAPLAEMNLQMVAEMIDRLIWPVGLSDHTLEPCLAPVVAVTLGACLVEKHLTLDRSLPGPDHRYALQPPEFRLMVDSVRAVRVVMGDGVKRVQPSEDATDRRAA